MSEMLKVQTNKRQKENALWRQERNLYSGMYGRSKRKEKKKEKRERRRGDEGLMKISDVQNANVT